MINKLRIRLSKLLYKLTVKITPPLEDTEEYKLLPEELQEPRDAAVELDDQPAYWQQEQHGNVVIVEPELMTRYRRGKL